MRKITVALSSLLIASALWLPAIHLFYGPPSAQRSHNRNLNPETAGLLERQLALWRHDANSTDDVTAMRETNSEWDLMGRTFLVLSLAELSLSDSTAAANHLPVIDRIINDTLRSEKEKGMHHFLMSYSRSRPYLRNPARSLFLDSEIAVMLGARRCIADSEMTRLQFTQRIEEIVACFQQSTNL